MGKVMRHTLGASLNIRHNLSSSKGPKPLQLKLLTTYIPKTSAFTLAFSTSQRLRTTRALSFISGRLATKSNQIKQLIRNGRSASLQRTFKKSFTSFSHSTRNKTRDGLIRVRNIRALNGRFNTSITHAYSIVIGSKHITLNATGGG